MEASKIEDGIQNNLINLDLQDHSYRYRSQDLLQTLKRTKFMPSFNDISDWTEKDQQSFPRQLSYQQSPKTKRVEEQYKKFTISLSKARLSNDKILPIFKKKIQVAPINMRFGFARSPVKQRSKDPFREVEAGHTSFYEANYQPLHLLYQMKTRSKQHNQHFNNDLPVLFQSKKSQSRLPKTERTSSIVRSMKKSQQLRDLRRKFMDPEAFKLPC